MAWVSIIAAILQLLGPIIAAWLQRLLERSAERLDFAPVGAQSPVTLINAAIEDCPWWAVGRRWALYRVQRVVIDHAHKIYAASIGRETIRPIPAETLSCEYGL